MTDRMEADDIIWLAEYAQAVRQTYGTIFAANTTRFGQSSRLLDRFQSAINNALERGREHFRSVDEAHNELCIAAAILNNTRPYYTLLTYEPPLPNSSKSIDFRAEAADQLVVFIDVKSVRPLPEEEGGWDRYSRLVRNGLVERDSLDLRRNCLGGELAHNMFSSRERFLEYTLELETKIAVSMIDNPKPVFALAFCGTGFEWDEHELQDFVSFYFSGAHRSDDLFGPIEGYDMNEKDQSFSKAIAQFGCMHRSHGELQPARLHWYGKRAAA